MLEAKVDYVWAHGKVKQAGESPLLASVQIPQEVISNERGMYILAALLWWYGARDTPHTVLDWDVLKCTPTHIETSGTKQPVFRVEEGNSGGIEYVSNWAGNIYAIHDDFGDGPPLGFVSIRQ